MSGLAQYLRIAAAAIIGVAAIAACGSANDKARTATGSRQPMTSQQFQVIGNLQTNGNPEPFVSNGETGATWSMCIPGARRCRPLATQAGMARTGPEPADTAFKISGGSAGHPNWRKLTWHGALHVIEPPKLSGAPHVGSTVRVSAARWSGGWDTAFDALAIEVCRTSRASRCKVLVGMAVNCHRLGCVMGGGLTGATASPDHVTVGSYRGWYLFAFDAHLAADISDTLGYASYAAIPPWPTNRIVIRSRPYGPIT